jgi:hypothetical protein
MLKDIHQELQEGNMDLFIKNMWALYCVDWTKVEDDEWDFYCSQLSTKSKVDTE